MAFSDFMDMTRKTWDIVADANAYYDREDKRPIVGHCVICRDEIRGEDDNYESDEAYNFDGNFVCNCCVWDYINRFHI